MACAGVALRSAAKSLLVAVSAPKGAAERSPLSAVASNICARPLSNVNSNCLETIKPRRRATKVRAEFESAPSTTTEAKKSQSQSQPRDAVSAARDSLEAFVYEGSSNGATQATPSGERVDEELDEGSILEGIEEPLPHQSEEVTGLVLAIGARNIPHPEKVEKGGEDAWLTSDHLGGAIGVADGVGGWAADGVDPALYSKEFVKHALEAVKTPELEADPRGVLHYAHTTTRSLGAATACIAMLGVDGKLRVANLGDSGLRVLRQGKMMFATPVLQHFFDCPFQFGPESSDNADNAEVFEVEVEEGDVLVMGSDGLFDNIFDKDIEAVASLFGGSDAAAAERVACALAALAKRHAADGEYNSPYILEAIEEGHDVPFWQKLLGKKLSGGKMDDITVVVAIVTNGVLNIPKKIVPTEEDAETVAEVGVEGNAEALTVA